MGSFFSRLFGAAFGSKQLRVLLLGLDNAGKTTTLLQMIGKQGETVPTIGFSVEKVKFGNVEFVVWDVAGQERLRPFWRHYYRGTSGVIFIVDATDKDRMPVAKKELHGILKEEELKYASLLILSNKMDLKGAMTTEEVAKHLDLATITTKTNKIFPTVAKTGQGLKEAITWLSNNMKPISSYNDAKG
eukprot:CAMPEP_0170195620 /NCGR_PEP_ID=MMETSP0040_2-20121228/61835_1 /TAXON_ID=641309 /ORGANISM="Lotharella oceanica, Strain CCMP622" /LENGTH=187 /DNA_ID=CAMNT_0010444821 /DNA_START=73 /DNA_END=636 /DNA_ORIENTATION=+